MKWIAKDVLAVTRDMLEVARDFRLRGEPVRPHVFLFVDTPGDQAAALVHAVDCASCSKQEHRAFIARAAAETRAAYVGRVDEAWATHTDGSPDENLAIEAWIRAGHSLEHYPDRVEIIHIAVDGLDLNTSFQCEILANNQLGPVTEQPITDGLFSNLSGKSVPTARPAPRWSSR